MAFKVIKIIDAQTIEVDPRWLWGTNAGSLVKIVGFSSISTQNSAFIINKLTTLLLNKDVDLKNPINTVIPVGENLKIEASVYLNNIDISIYFPELKTPA